MTGKITAISVILWGVLSAILPAREVTPFDGWREISTEHFVFVYEPADKGSAMHLASISEGIYDRVSSFYESYPDRIYCVVNGRSNIHGNFFYPAPAYISITVSAPTWPWFGARYSDWLELVFTHELTHGVQIPYESGPASVLAKIFGPALKSVPGGFLPAWASEGPAVLTETLFTTGGRGDTQFFEMFSKAMLLEEEFFTPAEAGSSTPFAPQQRPYVAGYLFASHMYDVYGPETLKDIHTAFVDFPLFGPNQAVKSVTGKTVSEHFADIRQGLLHRYREDFEVPRGVAATPDVYGNFYLPFVTERGWILYRSVLDKPAALVLLDPESGAEKVLCVASLTDPSSYAATSSGDLVVFTALNSRTGPAGSADYSDLYTYSLSTGIQTRITHNEKLMHPALSPDGATIVAVGEVGSESALFRVDRTSGALELLFRLPGASVYNPVFSEDGTTLIFAMKQDGAMDIWSLPYPMDSYPVEYNSAALRSLTGPDTGAEFFPRVSGQELIYASDRDGSLALYRRDLTSDEPAVLAAIDPVGAFAGTVDGNDIIYATYTAKGFAVKRKPRGAMVEPVAGVARSTTRDGAENPASPSLAVGTPEPILPIEESPYFDLPRFLLWAPLPIYYDPFFPLSPRLGAGVYFFADSILARNRITGLATFDWNALQPGIDIRGNIGFRRLDIGYGLYYGFNQTSDSMYQKNAQAVLSGSYPIEYEYSYPAFRRTTLSASISFISTARSDVSFAFAETPSDGSTVQTLFVGGGIDYLAARQGGRKDFFAPLLFSLWSDAFVYLPLTPSGNARPIYGAGTFFQFPSIVRHQVVSIGIDTTYTPWVSDGSLRPSPRGGLQFSSAEQNASFLVALDYRFNVGVIDLALPYGFSINQIAAGVFLESGARWNGSTGVFAIDSHLFPGFELILSIGSVSHIPVGLGVMARFDAIAPSSFSILDDIRVYLFTGGGGFGRGNLVDRSFLDAHTPVSYPVSR